MKFNSQVAVFALAITASTLAAAQGQGVDQTEKEFQQLMPITGTVETFFGDYKLDHSFPAVGEADKIYDLIDHQRAAQLYLWEIGDRPQFYSSCFQSNICARPARETYPGHNLNEQQQNKWRYYENTA